MHYLHIKYAQTGAISEIETENILQLQIEPTTSKVTALRYEYAYK